VDRVAQVELLGNLELRACFLLAVQVAAQAAASQERPQPLLAAPLK
jgi:hypothetical protein